MLKCMNCRQSLLMCCEDFELDTSNGRRQITAAACSDARSHRGDTEDVFWSFAVTTGQ